MYYKEDGFTIDYSQLKLNTFYKEDNGWNWCIFYNTGKDWIIYDPSADAVWHQSELNDTEDEDHRIKIFEMEPNQEEM